MPKHAGGARCLPQSRRRRSTSVSRARALAAPPIHAGPRPESIGGPARRRSTSDRGASPAPIRFPPDNFKHSLTLFSKSFSSFPRALDGIHRPIWAAFPNNPTRRQHLVVRQGPGTTGLSPSPAPPSRGLGPGPSLTTALQTTIRMTEPPDSKAGLFPVHSPLLRESLAEISVAEILFRLQKKHRSPRRTPRMGREGKVIDSSIPWHFPHRGSLVARRARWARAPGTGEALVRGFDNDPSAGSPTKTLLRLVLLLNDKVCSHSNPSQKIKVGRRCTPWGDPTNQFRCALRVYSPVDSHTCQTPWSVFEDGSNGEPTGQRPERADAEARQRRVMPDTIEETAFHELIESPSFGRPLIHTGPCPESIGGPAHRGSTSFSRGLGPGPPLTTALQTTIRMTEPPDSKAGLFPVHSPLLRESLQTCPRPNGFGGNLRSKTRWFTGFCNSQQVSHFATFFIDARAEISVSESLFRLQKKHRSPRRTPRTGHEGQAIDSSIPWRFPRRGSLVTRRAHWAHAPGTGEALVRGSPTETLLRLVLSLNDKGKTNLSHDGLNPSHVPYWWVNNPTLGEFCFTMIGRADIEGSKSNVAMNAWLPQASYPCGNFSDTSSFEFRRSKGSLGHAFTVRIRTGSQNQTSFYNSVPYEISVLVELILGHLRYLLTDVPPQPNSPPDNVFRPDRPTERALGPKRGAMPRFRFTE
ncbi:hypothetical protein CQW23_32683 [Capsicum baccatum]|uniref:Regulator of rDNA transcription protein 15 n=1 Tax=Capsicum baccatum TaxID=33114 RepID=A0A2G2V3Z7_CAPBA|nr:hypothetical protein CQW23_32683 [Capsicum baccatum]